MTFALPRDGRAAGALERYGDAFYSSATAAAEFTRNTGFAAVRLIPTRVRALPTSVLLPDHLGAAGEVLISNVRSIDTRARAFRFAGAAVPRDVAQFVRAKINAIITI